MQLKKIKKIGSLVLVLSIAIGMVPMQSQAYSRSKASAYAQTYALKRNPKYVSFEYNCTNFVSQALEAGGYKQNNKWYCGLVAASKPWAVANKNYNYVVNEKKWGFLKKKYSMSGNYARPSTYAPVAEGSIIYYQWDEDAEMDHASFVTKSGQDKSGMYRTLICQNSTDRKNVLWHLQMQLKDHDKKHGSLRAKKCIYYVVDI